jgi:flagellar motility protein MotE (MotC chaperone)
MISEPLDGSEGSEMNRILIMLTSLSLGILAATAMGSPGSKSTGTSVRSEQARGAEAIMDLLEERERGLKRREATLKAREEDLKAAEKEVSKRLAELQILRDTITGQLSELDGQQKDRVTKLVKMIASVRDKQAAAILAATDADVALDVLMRMNTSKAGKALAAMDPSVAAVFVKKMGATPLKQEKP